MDDLAAYFRDCKPEPRCICGHLSSDHHPDSTICLSRTAGNWGLRTFSVVDTMCPCFAFRTSGERQSISERSND